MKRAVVCGAGGFIGGHLVTRLKADGYWVRGADLKLPEYGPSMADEYMLGDLRHYEHCGRAVAGVDQVFQCAADMGGIGYISAYRATIARHNTLINAHMLEAARLACVGRYLFTSSACVYPAGRQGSADVEELREGDAMPADPERGYGWEKLYAEQLTTYYAEDHGLDVRIVRFHNIYGPRGAYEGGKEKAPAALCRKVAEAAPGGEVEVWGDGQQTRSYCYVDDCVEGLVRLMASSHRTPVNLGTDELVSVDGLVDTVAQVAGKDVRKRHDPSKPQGVRGRNSDNRLLRRALGWEPRTTLAAGIAKTYPWVHGELAKQGRAR